MIGWIILYSVLVGGAMSDSRIALVGCVLIGPIIGIMFIGGAIVCISELWQNQN